MGMYTATAGTDTWLARFGIDVEEIDQFELVRRAEEADPAEARGGGSGSRRTAAPSTTTANCSRPSCSSASCACTSQCET